MINENEFVVKSKVMRKNRKNENGVLTPLFVLIFFFESFMTQKRFQFITNFEKNLFFLL